MQDSGSDDSESDEEDEEEEDEDEEPLLDLGLTEEPPDPQEQPPPPVEDHDRGSSMDIRSPSDAPMQGFYLLLLPTIHSDHS